MSVDRDMRIGRRHLLATLAVVPAYRALPAWARLDGAADLEVFADVIRAVGGVATLPPQLLNGCVREFTHLFGREALVAMANLARAQRTVDGLAEVGGARVNDQLTWIATFLYTGETAAGAEYFPWCLGWHALAFTTAPGQCGGPFGYWADPQP